jgi:anti-sigma B factor antagonist
MTITKNITNDIAVIALQGRFDSAAADQFKKAVQHDFQPAHYVIEMEGVNYIDSGGLGCLVSLLRRAQKRSGSVKIARIPSKIFYAFELTRMNRIFDMYDDTGMAVNSFTTN